MATSEVRVERQQFRRLTDAVDDISKELHQLNSNLRKLIAAVGDMKEVDNGSAGQDAGPADASA